MERAYGLAPPGFRLPDETAVGAVRLQVGELRRSIDYYETVLGLRALTHTPGTAAMAGHGDARPLVWLHARTGTRPVPRRGAFGLYHFAILLPDRAALGRFAAHLSHIGVHAGTADHAASEAFYLSDPNGLGIEVYADRPRSEWQHRKRELVMTVDPLDVRGLVAAGSGRAWDGMPSGTRIGHVHLHVGDLGRAEGFYHAALGFDKVVWNVPGALFFSAGGYHHHLATNTWAPGPAAAEDQARLLEWELLLRTQEDASAAARSVAGSGHPVEHASEGTSRDRMCARADRHAAIAAALFPARFAASPTVSSRCSVRRNETAGVSVAGAGAGIILRHAGMSVVEKLPTVPPALWLH